MRSLYVELGPARYPIYIGSNLLQQAELFIKHLSGQQVFIVSNSTVGPLYAERLKENCTDRHVDVLLLPDGEQYKTLATLEKIFDTLLTQHHKRTTTLIALGGGVVGDVTGFAAACYMRGVNFIQVPTSLLAQVDSSVGGKTAINHPHGKNMIGAFYQPSAVIIDTKVLHTLPAREFCAGLAEVIKYGLLYDAEFFVWLEQNQAGILKKDEALIQQMIFRCCEIKATIVAADEHELGIRALLNLGHSFGHAIEKGLGYGTWLHGEAVAVGLLLAADLSCRLGKISIDLVTRIKNLLLQFQLPVSVPATLPPHEMLALMHGDKKNINTGYRLILLTKLGTAVICEDVSVELLQQTLLNHTDGVSI